MNRPNLPKLDFSAYPKGPKQHNFLTMTLDEQWWFNKVREEQAIQLKNFSEQIMELDEIFMMRAMPEPALTKLRDMCNNEIERRKIEPS